MDAGPNNNWMSPKDAQERVWPLFDGAMTDRTMYVVPYLMGPIDSPYSKVGVEVTDSAYVVANMRIMTRMGKVALDRFSQGGGRLGARASTRSATSRLTAASSCTSPTPARSGVSAPATAATRYLARSASLTSDRLDHGPRPGLARRAHADSRLESPDGDVTYIAGAFPSACGKTNLAMLKSPFEDQGWRVWTVGEDICLDQPRTGRPSLGDESGSRLFRVAPGTNMKTNPNAMEAVQKNRHLHQRRD